VPVKAHPALDVRADATDLILAAVDDFSPTAVEEGDDSLRVFFSSTADRDAARLALTSRFPVRAVDVPDEDWARRSQDNLQSITIGRVTIHPRPNPSIANQSEICTLQSEISVLIPPSMGFGTGHHATTRMCVAALQAIDVAKTRVLDVGTGSGILAIAAAALGASRALGIDTDGDAIQAARENLELNSDIGGVTFEVVDLASMAPLVARTLGAADIVLANLTGALHVRSVEPLLAATRPGGLLILSGLQVHERDDVQQAFAAATIVREWTEDEWVCLVMKRS
jgi:ribosomal protein L11 methyltransferase